MAVDVSLARAVFSDAFQFPGTSLGDDAPEVIERDRLIMAARPGMIRKLLPVRQDATGVYCGGVYLFDSFENARAYGDWCANDFVLDGTQFLDRPTFLEPTSEVWHVAGAEDFGDVADEQNILRFERWYISGTPDVDEVRQKWWPSIRDAARDAGATTAWLLISPDEFHPQLGLVTAAKGDVSEADRRAEDSPSLQRVAAVPSPAAELADSLNGTKVFDRTSWIYMIWHPIEEGDASPHTAQWPASPPLPGLDALA